MPIGDPKFWRVITRDSVGPAGRTLQGSQARELCDECSSPGSDVVFIDLKGHEYRVPRANVVCIEPRDPKADERPVVTQSAYQPAAFEPPVIPEPPAEPPAPPVDLPPPAPPHITPGTRAKGRGGKWARKDAALNIVPAHLVQPAPLSAGEMN